MSYTPKTDWQYNDVLTEQDMNRIENGIDAGKQLTDTHMADQNNPHGVTAEQIGAETPAGAQAKVDAHASAATGAHMASSISLDDTGNNFTAPDVEGAMIELFSSVSNGKSLVATAITGKGSTVAGTAPHTFQELKDGVNSIFTGKKMANGTVTSNTAGIISVRGLSFRPSLIILKWGNSTTGYSRKVYHPLTDFSVNLYTSGTGWISRNVNLIWLFGGGTDSNGVGSSPGDTLSNYWTTFPDGFETYVQSTNQNVTWYAYE